MSAAVFFVVQTLFELYILCYLLRLVLQITRADFHNPLSPFIVRVTSPIVSPLRRFVPAVRGLDTACLLYTSDAADDEYNVVRSGVGGGV